jgi:uncharacterized protein
MDGKKTLVIGASTNTERYSNLAVKKLVAHNHPVVALGKRSGMIGSTDIITEKKMMDDIHTITLYLNPENQKPYYDYILALKPKRIIFNPGTENDELESLAKENGIKTMEACTLVLLSTSQY